MADHLKAQASQNLFPRSSGVLLHVTSLPGPDGIGDLGTSARNFVDWLASAGQSLWQILPLGPTGFGDSPYQTLSAFAGNPLLVSLETLVDDGWLKESDFFDRPDFSQGRVDYGPVITWKTRQLDLAWERFGADGEANASFRQWCAQEVTWLDDYGLFMALRDEHESQSWVQWDAALVRREDSALAEAQLRLKDAIAKHQFLQWLFARQWEQLKNYAAEREVRFFGDVPLFVAHDSCDVWANQDLFELDAEGRPTQVAGVPPDYFSETGQLWGNPLYRWQSHQPALLDWWSHRLRSSLALVDLLRIDHFRGLEAYWSIPATEKTAVKGSWVPGPGMAFFAGMSQDLPSPLPLVAEDLGVITPEVEALREAVGLPGMKILQFAWDGPENAFLPHNCGEHAVVYTGTHDNDPTVGWWRHLTDEKIRDMVSQYVGHSVTEPHWTLIRLGMMSAAHTFVAPMQDVLGLGREGRMNLPGEGSGNWNWRLRGDDLENADTERLAKLTWLYNRSRTDKPPLAPRDTT